jgi:hypothetical protein
MSKVCVIYPTGSLVEEFGSTFEGKVGVCVIDGDIASTSIIHRSQLRSVTDGFDCVPSQGRSICLLPLDDELEAYSRIRKEAASLVFVSRPRLPSGFYRPQALWFGTFALAIEVGSLRIKVGHGLATALGWREGDGIVLGVSSDQRTLAFCYDANGSRLSGGDLMASYPLGVGLSRELETLCPGKWVPVAVEVRDHVVFVRLEDFVEGAKIVPSDVSIDVDMEDPLILEGKEIGRASPILTALYWCASWMNAITPIR